MANPVSKRLAEISTALGFPPCHDAGCIFGDPGGQHTNGGCQHIKAATRHEDRVALRQMSAVAQIAIGQLLDEEARHG